MVAEEVAKVLSIDAARIDPSRPLHDLGLDSLMAVELALGLEKRFGVRLPAMMINDAPTVGRVAARIAGLLGGGGDKEATEADAVVEMAIRHGEELDSATVDGFVADMRRLSRAGTRMIQ